MSGMFILDGKRAVPCNDLDLWASALEKSYKDGSRRVGDDTVGDVRVSTVFLGIDHNHWREGEPLLFETMVFGGALDGAQERCSTWEQAEAQHAGFVARARAQAN